MTSSIAAGIAPCSGSRPDKADTPAASEAPVRPRLHIAFYLDHLRSGGVQKMRMNITGNLVKRGHKVDLVVCEASGPLRDHIPAGVRLVELQATSEPAARAIALASDPGGFGPLAAYLFLSGKTSGTLPYVADLARYLRRERPSVLCSGTDFLNVEAALARRRAGVSIRLVISVHNDLSHGHPLGQGWRGKMLAPLLSRTYHEADGVVAVSDGVAEDLAKRTGLARDRITTIYNPAVTPRLTREAEAPLDHPWFAPGAPPVVLSAGRLGTAKDFPTLVRAFALVRRDRPARLVIFGEAKNARKTEEEQAELRELAAELGIADDVQLPGYAANPFPYMSQAGVFALSSAYEGFGNVLAEALACGCPVVSTNCPSGPAEILGFGEYGALVPVRDHEALARAILQTLDSPPNRDRLRRRGALFSVKRAVDRYEALFQGV